MPRQTNVPKRVTSALLGSLGAGVTPRVGLEHVVVGRKGEIQALLGDLGTVEDGGATFRILLGRYGSGKSFLLQLVRTYALERNLVVADVDLSPERRLTGTKGQGLATYRELVHNLATRTRPDGGALKVILERWIDTLRRDVLQESNTGPMDPALTELVERRIFDATAAMENLVHGFDFGSVVSAYWRGHREEDEALKSAALRWMRGEYTTKTEARQDLGVRAIIDDDSWYDYVKLLAEFVRLLGYRGLVVVIDEAVNLYKITNTTSRNNNYEKFLTIVNDTLQGRAAGLGVVVAGTPRFLEDERRGLFSYEALKSRLQPGRFSGNGWVDLASPVIRLNALSNEEILLLLKRLRGLHAAHYGTSGPASDTNLVAFMEEVLNQLGASEFLTPRDVIRDFIGVLNLLQQNPTTTFGEILGGGEFHPTTADVAKQIDREEAVDETFADFEL